MSIFSGFRGDASEFTPTKAEAEFGRLLSDGETIEAAFKLIRDVFLFTNRRLIMIDKQGITGRKVEYMSIPYKSIVRFSIESSGSFDLDAELKIWLTGTIEPIQQNFNRKLDIYTLQRILAGYVAR